MDDSRLNDGTEVNRVLIDGFNAQEDVGIFLQLPGYDDFQGSDL